MLGAIRMVLPGIIVSLIGGTAGILIFNNPNKNKGRSTQSAWHSVIQYEKIYDENVITTTRFAEMETIEGIKKYKGDIMHQIQMLSENFKNTKEEGNVDNRLFAIINCKVDTYDQILKLTDVYLDSLIHLAENPQKYVSTKNETDSSYARKIEELSYSIMNDYNRIKLHLINRDTSTINNILSQLTQSYIRPLYKFYFTNRLPDEYKNSLNNLYGKWNFLITPGSFTLNKDKTGTLTLDEYTRKGRWELDRDFQFRLTTEAKDSFFTFHVLNVTDKTVRLAINDSIQLIGYKEQ